MASTDPSKPSNAYGQMSPGWQMIDDILAGPAAVRSAGPRYLPKYAAETQAEYDRRRGSAPWQGEFEDILRSLASKPFAKDVTLKQGATPAIQSFVEDVDQRGNNLTAFSRDVFEAGVAKGCHAIMIDYTQGPFRTLADQIAAGARPYWVSIRAEDILDLRTDFVRGRETVVNMRLSEWVTVRDGYDEKTTERVRELFRLPNLDDKGRPVSYGPPSWVIWEKQITKNGDYGWVAIDSGQFSPITEIPVVLFWTGRRRGPQFVQPPLMALADKQIELYRALSRQDEVLTYAGSPMLSADGISPPPAGETLDVGPKRILYAPGGGGGRMRGWSYVQPDAANIREIREGIGALVDDIRRLGMQPLSQRSGAVTATATSIEGARAHSAVQAWAIALKDALEQALVFTSQWLGEQPTAEVVVHTDFLAGIADQVPLDALTKARANGDISRTAYVEALKRFGVLAPDFNVAADEEQLALETQGLEAEPGLHLVSDQAA